MKHKQAIPPILLFLISPFVAFIKACGNLRNKANALVFISFYALFGFCHQFTDVRSDSYRKYRLFSRYEYMDLSDIWANFIDGKIMDIYESLLFMLIHPFSANPHVMMMIVGLLGSIFILLSIKRILSEMDNKDKPMYYLMTFLLVLLFTPQGMGGIRGFTAIGVFAYSSIRFLVDKKKLWFIGILICPLIHFSYTVSIPVVLIARYIRVPKNFLFSIVVVSILASPFISTSISSKIIADANISEYNQSIDKRVQSYADEDTQAEFHESLTFHLLKIQTHIRNIFLVVFLFFVRKHFKYDIEHNNRIRRTYMIMLYFLLFVSLASSFSVVGGRFLSQGLLFLYLFWAMLLYAAKDKKATQYLTIYTYASIITIAWNIYNAYCTTGLYPLFLPLPIAIAL